MSERIVVAEELAQLFSALGSDTRIRILRELEERALCVGALAMRLDVTPSAISQHLTVLRNAGLVRSDRQGSFVHYRLTEDARERCRVALDSIVQPPPLQEDQPVKLGIVITQNDPETVFNTLRLALYSLEQGDQVRIFLSGKGVEIDQIDDPAFDVKAQAQAVVDAGGEFLACGICLKLRNSDGSEICPLSTLRDHYEVVRGSDRLVTV